MTNWVILGSEVMREAREAKGLSREAVGRELSVSSKTYERWEIAGRVPRHDLERVARAIGLQVEVAAFPATTVTLPDEPTPPNEEVLAEVRALRDEIRELREMLGGQGQSGSA